MKNNLFEKNNIYSLRKFKVGLASVTIGGMFVLTGGIAVASDTNIPNDNNTKIELNIEENKGESLVSSSEKNNIDNLVLKDNSKKEELENLKSDKKEENITIKEELFSINYKVIYVDEKGETVHSEHHTVLSDEIEGKSEKEVTVDFNDNYGFKLATNQEKSITKVIKHNEKNIIEFRVTTKEEKIKEETKLFASSTPVSNDAPYITIERYFGNVDYHGNREDPNYTYTKNGDTVEIVYQMGLTRISGDEVELTDDAKKLGLKYDPSTNRITGNVTLGETLEIRTYDIGLQKKGDPSIKTSADIHIQSHKGFVPRLDGTAKDGKYVAGVDFGNITSERSIRDINLESSSLDNETTHREFDESFGKPSNKLIYNAEVTVTPFGYFVDHGTIKDAKKDQSPYEARIALIGLDNRETFGVNTLSIKEFKQTGGSDNVEVELIDKMKDYPTNYYEPLSGRDVNGGYIIPERTTPYLVRFKKLPNTAGKYFVEFKVVDNLGLEKNFRINLTTFEKSQDGALTIADVKFENNKDYDNSGVDHVVAPRSAEEQNLGKIIKNKDNSNIVPINLPDWLEYDDSNNTLKKKSGKNLEPGIYTVDFKAVDGHFNESGPARTFIYEISDVLNNIGHKVWTEGTAIDDIPVSFESGTKIEKLKVVYNGYNALLSSSSNNNSINGYATKRTTENQTAEVFATYLNKNGQKVTVRTTFTFEVKPNEEVNNLELSVTNNTQTIKEGETFQNMVVSVTEGAELIIDKSLLPDDVVYDESSKTFSGKGLYEGFYKIPIIAKKNGLVKTAELNLTIEPGEFTLKPIVIDIDVLEHLNEVVDFPKNVIVEYNTNYRYDNKEDSTDEFFNSGFSFDNLRKLVSGRVEKVGTYTLDIVGKRFYNGKTQTSNSTITINVRPISHELTITNKNQTIYIGDSIEEISVNTSPNAEIDYVYADHNLNLSHDRSKNIITAKPIDTGTYTFDVVSRMRKSYREELAPNEYGGYEEKRETVTIIVKNRLELEAENREVTVKDKMVDIPVNINMFDERIDKNKVSLSVRDEDIPKGVNFDPIKKIFSGIPEEVNTYYVTIYANYEGIEESIGVKTITIQVNPITPTIEISNNNETYEFGKKIKPSVISNSAHSDIAAYYLGSILSEDDISDYVSKEWGLKYDKTNKTISGTPKNSGTYQLRFKAILPVELGGKEAEILYKFTVLPESKISLEVENDRQFILQGDSIRNIRFINSDNTDIEFDVESLPEGLQYNSESKTITGIPKKSGRYDLTVTAREKEGNKTITKTVALDVFYIPGAVIPKESSEDPLIDVLTEGDTTISGKGVPGSTIVLRFPDGTISENTIVTKEGTWTVSTPKKLNKGETITVKQTESGKEQSDAISSTVIPNLNNIPSKAITIEKVENNNGNIDVTFSDGTKITIPKGEKGEKGDVGNRGIDGEDGKDGKSPIITLEPKENGSTLTIVNPDGNKETYEIRNGKDGVDGKDGKDGKSPIITLEPSANGSTLTIVNPDGNKETYEIRNGKDGVDGKDGKTSSIVTEEGKDKEGNSGLWIIVKDGDNNITEKTFIRYCGCKIPNEKPEKPDRETPKVPEVVTPEKPNGEEPKVPEIVTPEKPNGEEPKVPEVVTPEKPNGEEPKVPEVVKPEKSNVEKPQVSDIKASKNYKLSNTGYISNDTLILGIITILIALITISNRKRND